MAKQKEEKTNVMRILEQKGIPFTPHTYPHEEGVAVDGASVARSLGQDPECVFKTLVARGASGGLYVFDIPVEDTLDLKKAARAVGAAQMAATILPWAAKSTQTLRTVASAFRLGTPGMPPGRITASKAE